MPIKSNINIYAPNKHFNLDLTLRSANGSVLSLCQLSNQFLVSSSSDNSIKIWCINAKSYKILYRIDNSHSNSINKVIALSNLQFASCSFDFTIKVWSIEKYTQIPIATLRGHKNKISSLLYIKKLNFLISGAWDKTIRLWSLVTYV